MLKTLCRIFDQFPLSFADKTPEVRAAQDVDLKAVLCKLNPNIPLVCVCGNHDVGDNPTVESIAK